MYDEVRGNFLFHGYKINPLCKLNRNFDAKLYNILISSPYIINYYIISSHER